MMWHYDMGWHGWGWLGMVVFWLALVLVAALVWRSVAGGKGSAGPAAPPPGKTALDYLDEAYAKGEISREDFLQKRADLQRS